MFLLHHLIIQTRTAQTNPDNNAEQTETSAQEMRKP
jgi:hypothetical protein